jgi:hypothetical protein
MLLERYLASADYPPAEMWRLVEWCGAHGASEFAVECMGETDSPVWSAFERAVHPYALGERVRRRMSGQTVDDLTRPTALWALNPTTIDALRAAFPRGVLEYFPAKEGWFEDLALYREGELMFGAITHEQAAVLRITDREYEEFAALGFRSHAELPYIGY